MSVSLPIRKKNSEVPPHDSPFRGSSVGGGVVEEGVWVPKYPLGLIDRHGYVRVPVCRISDKKGVYVPLHREIAQIMLSRQPLSSEIVVHHIDGNKLNNHWKNLRLCDREMHDWVSLRRGWRDFSEC